MTSFEDCIRNGLFPITASNKHISFFVDKIAVGRMQQVVLL